MITTLFLPLMILTPLIFAVLIALMPRQQARPLAVIGTLAAVVVYLFPAFSGAFLGDGFNWFQAKDSLMLPNITWFGPLGLSFAMGADSISMLLVGLTVLLGPICVFASFTAITDREKTYYGWLLALQAAMTGVFLARDVILFFVFFEFTLIPMFILISLFGSTNRRAAAIKFFLYTFTGSILTLAGLVYTAYYHARVLGYGWSFGFGELATAAQQMPLETQVWVFAAFMAGFAIKVPVFPVHTWLPLAHTEAPTAGSVVLAGVLLKLGTYGIYRFALGFTPMAAVDFAPLIAGLAIVGILYAGLICWVQTDVKKLVAYSSVSHLGFCVLGLFALGSIGLSGSILYMINHGLSTGALFLLIGMVYERYHTRSMKELGGLASKMPIWSTFMVFFTMASVGLPGLNGFVSEFMCLLGAFQAGEVWEGARTAAGVGGRLGPWYAGIAGIGMIVTAIYLLYMLGQVVWGELREPGGHGGHGHGHGAHGHTGNGHAALPRDLSLREIGVLTPLAIGCVVLGLFPSPVLRTLERPTQEMARTLENARQNMRAARAPGIETAAAVGTTSGPEAVR